MPYLVNATAGTTVFGVYDPLDKIADICQKYGLWMHVDGAWGGSALLSKTYRGLLKGIDRYLQTFTSHMYRYIYKYNSDFTICFGTKIQIFLCHGELKTWREI